MVITILAEPRSGSTNLAAWFSFNKSFTIFYEPLNIGMKKFNEYKGDTSPKKWKYNTPHLVIKEIYTPNKNVKELIEISDKLIILYRENQKEQFESWSVASETDNWSKPWAFDKVFTNFGDASYFNSIKKGIKDNYLNNDYFNISYEELYYNNGFQKVLNYLDIDCLENKNFPHGSKYRINVDKRTNLI